MTPIEDLLRQTFTEHAQDVTGPPLLPASPTGGRHGRNVAILAGAAAVAAVLVGSTVALDGGGSGPTTTAAAKPALRFTPAPITSAEHHTSAVFRWAATWTPAPASGYEVTEDLQARFFGEEAGHFAAVAIGRGDCTALERFRDEFDVNLRWNLDLGRTADGKSAELCRRLPGGGSLGVVIHGVPTAQAAAEARRVADSVRPGRAEEIALPVSFPAGSTTTRMTVRSIGRDSSQWYGRRWDGNIDDSTGAGVYVGPVPEQSQFNATVGGRPAQVNDYTDGPSPFTMVRLLLRPAIWTNTTAPEHARAIEVAAHLDLGAVPDYPWVH
jgi:hypothetical protein